MIDDISVTDAGVAGPCTTGEPAFFADGFESGDTGQWALVVP